MQRFRDVEHAVKVMTVFRGWVGTPAIKYRGELQDGRIRLDAYKLLRFPTSPPILEPASKRDFIRALVAAGESVRAEQWVGAQKFEDFETAQALLRLSRSEVAPIVDRRQRYAPSRVRPARHHMHKVKRLYWRAFEEGLTSVSLRELGECLDGWEGRYYV